jgi:hypothetical protein
LEQVGRKLSVVIFVVLTVFQAVVPILLQGMSALVKERFASLTISFFLFLFLFGFVFLLCCEAI